MHGQTVCFVFLLIFVFTNSSEHHRNKITVKFSKNRKLTEIVQDDSCVMLYSDMNGVINTTVRTNVTSRKNFTRPWVGAYHTKVWLDFKGCNYGYVCDYSKGLNVSLYGNPAKTCFLHCNCGEFVLTEQICYCLKHVQLIENNSCKAKQCNNNPYQYCASGAYVSNGIEYNCMCRYDKMIYRDRTSAEYNCMAATYKDNLAALQTSNCSSDHRGLCFDPSNPGNVSRSPARSWSDSLLSCYGESRQFAGVNTFSNPTWPQISDGVYWVGVFGVPFTLWGDKTTSTTTTSTRMSSNTDVKLCGDKTTSTVSSTSATSTTSSTSTTSTTSASSTRMSSNTDGTLCGNETISTLSATSDNKKETSPVSAIIGSIVGVLLCAVIIAVIFVLLCRRGVFRKQPTTGLNDAISDRFDITFSQRATSDTYDHLNDFKRESMNINNDLYDHSSTGLKYDDYDRFGTVKHDNDGEYDCASTMRDNYGHTQKNTSRCGDNNEYDNMGSIVDNKDDGAYGNHDDKEYSAAQVVIPKDNKPNS